MTERTPAEIDAMVDEIDAYYTALAAQPTEQLKRWADGLASALASIRVELEKRRAQEAGADR
jgi:hypothetical protein